MTSLRIRADIDAVSAAEQLGLNLPGYRFVSSGVELGVVWLNIGQVTGKDI